MGICSVCYQNCRGRCAKCGVSLCVQHRPKTSRAKCPLCPTSPRKGQGVQGNAYYTPSTPQAQAAYSAAQPTRATTATRPPVRPPTPPPHDFDDMAQQDIKHHIESLAHRLELKQTREVAYLQRRYDRGTYTPTDQAYGEDQILEDELLELLRFISTKALS